MELEDVVRYESAAVAAMNIKERPRVALASVTEFYKSALGKDFDGNLENEENDPVIRKALLEASAGVAQDLGITNIGVINSIGTYAQKYEKTLGEIKVSTALNYFGKAYQIPESVIEGLSQYKDLKISELEDKTAKQAIDLIKIGRLKKIGLAMELKYSDEDITNTLLRLYPQKKKEDKISYEKAA